MMQQPSLSKRISLVRCLAALTLLVAACVLGASACGSDSVPPDQSCKGVVFDGQCEVACKTDVCLHDDDPVNGYKNLCVANRCQLVCSSLQDCFNYNEAGGWLRNTQDCSPAEEDGTKQPILTCQTNGKARGFGKECPFGNECDSSKGGEALFACPNGAPCGPDQCHEEKPECQGVVDPAQLKKLGCNRCEKDPLVCRGVADCQVARCTNDLSPCSLTEQCPAEQCQPFTCNTTGDDKHPDADAYCTHDCTKDEDCPGGYWCGVYRDPRKVCNTDKGGQGLCADNESPDPCVDPKTAPPGTSFFEGAECLERRVCLKRTQCAPCTTDLDCTQVDGQKCANTSDGTVCARLCNKDSDCEPDALCDTSQGGVAKDGTPSAGSCIPRFGKCKGTGKFCEACRNDEDCGSTAMCYRPSLSLETGCMSFPLESCVSDTDCPLAPNMKHGHCGTSDQGSLYHLCFYEFTGDSFTCWK